MDARMDTLTAEPVFADDLLRGAEEIALFLYGDRKFRRRVYYLAETSRLPVFRLGTMLCARRSKLMRWIEEQEDRGRHFPPRGGKPPAPAASGSASHLPASTFAVGGHAARLVDGEDHRQQED